MKILSLDLGKVSAWYTSPANTGEDFKIESLSQLKDKVTLLMNLYNPDVILYPQPTRYYNVMRKHWQYVGVINLVAEKNDIQTIEVIDITCKKAVIGSGKAKKEDVMEYYKESSEHVADARMFIDYYLKQL
jgi:Holliday junction resolvasome RuvABC endonuclease subunit